MIKPDSSDFELKLYAGFWVGKRTDLSRWALLFGTETATGSGSGADFRGLARRGGRKAGGIGGRSGVGR
jgi:hypothetical protein